MAADEREFRIRPRRPRAGRDEARVWTVALKRIIRIARMTSRRGHGDSPATRRATVLRPFSQRCAVRVTYSRSTTKGQWRAHGRYLMRESAAGTASRQRAGFGPDGRIEDLAAHLDRWQAAGDTRLFKLILSPEFGERVNLERLTQDLMSRMERDLDTRLEWAAVVHHNTEHPHVHIALRGIREDGTELRLERGYIQHGLRAHVEDLCTAQLGYRTELDAAEAQRREVTQQRFTSLDRVILRNAAGEDDPEYVCVEPASSAIEARLRFLSTMGLSDPSSNNRWRVRRDLETILRAMQRAGDRQKALAAHAEMLSDPRLPLVVTNARDISELEGRVLGHGEDESTGQLYLLLEGTDAKVHFIYQNAAIAEARRAGKLRAGSFARFRRRLGRLEILDYGDAERLLSNGEYFRNSADRLAKKGILPDPGSWGGWQGRYEGAVADAYTDLAQGRSGTLRSSSILERSR
jgi:type IV secretory pathway VirD2 relaxase